MSHDYHGATDIYLLHRLQLLSVQGNITMQQGIVTIPNNG